MLLYLVSELVFHFTKIFYDYCLDDTQAHSGVNLGGGVLPHMGYIGMCGPKGYGFSAVLVINRVSISADFGHFGHK